MNKTITTTGAFVKTLACYFLLKLLQLSGFVLPSWGTWAKQKFFILTAYHELKRHSLLVNLPLEQVNSRLLQIKQHAVLVNVSEISQWNVIHLDLNKIRDNGVDIDGIMRGSKCSPRDLEVIAHAIMNSTPNSLNYGRNAMFTDLQRMLCQAFQSDSCAIA